MTAAEYLRSKGELRVRSDIDIVVSNGFVGMYTPEFIMELIKLLNE